MQHTIDHEGYIKLSKSSKRIYQKQKITQNIQMCTRIILTRKLTQGEWKRDEKSAQRYKRTNLQRKEKTNERQINIIINNI